MHLKLLIVSMIVLGGCTTSRDAAREKYDAEFQELFDNKLLLFPGLRDSSNRIDLDRNRWYGSLLRSMNEGSLEAHELRIIYIPSWLPQLTLRIAMDVEVTEKKRDVPDPFANGTNFEIEKSYKLVGGKLVLKKTDSKGALHVGNLVFEKEVPLSAMQVQQIIDHASTMNLSHLPTDVKFMNGLDGCTVILEMSHQDEYAIIERWSPTAWEEPTQLSDLVREEHPYFDIDAYRKSDRQLVGLIQRLLELGQVNLEEFENAPSEFGSRAQ